MPDTDAAQHGGMRSLIVSTLLVALPAVAGPYAPHEYDFSEVRDLEASAFGIVESVREFSARQEVVVRLEDGREVVVMRGSEPQLKPGERVRLVGNFIQLDIRKEYHP